MKDLLGKELSVGDHVVYPTGSGSSKHMCVAQIDEIHENELVKVYDWSDKLEERTWVKLQPLVYNDYRGDMEYIWNDETWESGKRDIIEKKPKTPNKVRVWKIENLVKVELDNNE